MPVEGAQMAKKVYIPPRLIVYGGVEELTEGATS